MEIWEHGNNILFKSVLSDGIIAEKYHLSQAAFEHEILKAKVLLLKEREKRIRPALDDKILTSWNGLMLKGYVDAYRTFGNGEYLERANKNVQFLSAQMMVADGRLFRNYKNGKASINAFLDDYAFVIDAFIALYQVTFEEKWLKKARLLAEYVIRHFYDEDKVMFYYTSVIDPPLITRKIEMIDNVIPSGNSQMAKNLYLLGHLYHNDNYISMAGKMADIITAKVEKGTAFFANWDILLSWIINKPYEVAIVGEDVQAILKECNKSHLPNVFFSGGKDEGSLDLFKGKWIAGQTTIYVCHDKVCELPTTDVKEVLKMLSAK